MMGATEIEGATLQRAFTVCGYARSYFFVLRLTPSGYLLVGRIESSSEATITHAKSPHLVYIWRNVSVHEMRLCRSLSVN